MRYVRGHLLGHEIDKNSARWKISFFCSQFRMAVFSFVHLFRAYKEEGFLQMTTQIILLMQAAAAADLFLSNTNSAVKCLRESLKFGKNGVTVSFHSCPSPASGKW